MKEYICECPGCQQTGVIALTTTYLGTVIPTDTKRYCVDHCEVEETRANEYGFLAKRTHVTPIEGMPCTFHVGSDRYPGTVLSVSKSGKTILVQRRSFKAAAGHDYFGSQKWEIGELEGAAVWYTLRRNGRWSQKGQPMKYSNLGLGYARVYQDPHF